MTTFSRLLTVSDLEPLKQMTQGVELLSLQQFETEHSFLKKIRFVVHSEKYEVNIPKTVLEFRANVLLDSFILLSHQPEKNEP